MRISVRGAVSLSVVLAAAVVTADHGPQSIEGEEKVVVSWRVLATPSNGATALRLGASPWVGVGERNPGVTLAFNAASGDCSSTMSVGSPSEEHADAELLWTMEAEVTEASTDRIVLNAEWARLEGVAASRRQTAGESVAALVLKEGESRLLDFVGTPTAQRLACAQNLALELSASIREDPTLENHKISYDLWLVDEMPSGSTQNRRWTATGRQGNRLSFTLETVALPALANDEAERLDLDVEGTLRGRVRPDGSLDLSLTTRRTLTYSGTGHHMAEDGSKRIRVRPGEVIRVELPGPPCASGHAPCSPENVRQPFGRDMEGHTFALVVVAKPL